MAYRDTSIEGRFLRGDLEALATVVRWIAAVVASPRFGSLRSEWLDLHQEIMGRVVESLRQERFDESQDFRAYVQAVARYTALQAMNSRHRKDAIPVLNEEHLGRAPGAEASVVSRHLARQVLEQASDGCRELLRAYFLDQRSYAEIAESLGVPVGTVKSRLVRCLEKAHRVLHGQGSRRHVRPD